MECGICDGKLEATGKTVEVKVGKFTVKTKEAKCNKCGEVFYIIEAKNKDEVKITIRG
jgi:formylmethanofuran dehydrogenase subunit E